MAIRLHFWGAAQTVTGSSHHLECAGQNVLLDCGLFQGHRQQAREINEHLALPAEQLNAMVLSHAHIDHSGNLPLSVKQGYRGPISTTPSTVDLCEKMLKDSAHIQESDAEFVNRRAHRRRSIGVAGRRGGGATLHAGGCGTDCAAVQAGDDAYSAVAGGLDGGRGIYDGDV
jgi:metallo-beta-lactamase family protein